MVRTVRVRLELDRNDFKQGLRESAGDLRAFDTEVKTLGKDTDRTSTGLRSTSTEAKRLGDDVKRSARDLDAAGTAMKRIGTETEKARGSIKLFGKDLVSLGGGGKGQGLLGGALGGGLNAISGQAPTGIVQWLVGAAVIAAPAMGAAISAGVLLGVGGGTLAGGIILAAKDPAVKNAFTSLGTEVAGDLGKASQVFVQPLVGSADIFRAAWADVGPQISHDFDMVAPSIDHLSAGVAGFAHNVMPGFNQSVAASVPLLNQLGDDTLPRMGSAIGDFFSAISQGGPGAQAFFRDLTTGADLSVKQLGGVTLALTKMYDVMRSGGQGDNIFEKMSHAAASATLGGTFDAWTTGLEKLDGGAKKAGDSVKRLKEAADAGVADSMGRIGFQAGFTGDELGKLSSKIGTTAITIDSLAGQMTDKLLGATLGLDQATLGFAQAQTQLSQSIAENGRQLGIHTAKGEANRQAVLGAVAANIAEYDSMIRAGSSAQEAAAAYDANTGALERQLQKAGFTQAAIDGLIGKYRGVPANVNTDIQTHGLQEAINSLEDAIRLANNLDGRVSVITIEERHRITYSADTPPSQFFRGLAEGGIVAAEKGMIATSPTILFGERKTGREVYIPEKGISDQRGLMLANTAANMHGGRVVAGGSSTTTNAPVINIYGAIDPQATARAVRAELTKMARDSDLYARAG
jgi:hypothetical protein